LDILVHHFEDVVGVPWTISAAK